MSWPRLRSVPPPLRPRPRLLLLLLLQRTLSTATEAVYAVRRTRFGQLPVYSEIRNGGTRKLTIVQRIDGDVHRLRHDLAEAMALSNDEIHVKPINNHIVIKGHCVGPVKQWLTERGY